MSYSRRAALESLRLVHDALREGVSYQERHHLAKVQRVAIGALEASAHRPETVTMIGRIAKLERDLAEREPGERSAIIRHRLGLSRSAYYRLRRLALSLAS